MFFLGAFVALFFVCMPVPALAALDVSVQPAVIDGEGHARDILRYTVTVTNLSDETVSLYPWVRDLNADGIANGTENLDPTISLARWLEFSRTPLDMLAGESVTLPILAQINLNAKPGNYHANIYLSNGTNRAMAESNKEGTVSIVVNIRVEDDVNERLQLGLFSSEKNFFVGEEANFDYRLENTGNRGVVPTGKIRIFDRKGEEVATIDANATQEKLEPDAKQLLGAVWQSGDYFGRYKAMLDLEYGKSGTIQDTVFFWVLPWTKIGSLFATLAFFAVLIAILAHSYFVSGRPALVAVPIEDSVPRPHRTPGAFLGVFRRKGRHAWRRLMNMLPKRAERVIDEIREADIPPPNRTRYMVSEPTTHHAVTHHTVRLAHRPKAAHDPRHIVHLKSK